MLSCFRIILQLPSMRVCRIFISQIHPARSSRRPLDFPGTSCDSSTSSMTPSTEDFARNSRGKSHHFIRLGQTDILAVNISLPYQAFDLQVTQPITENGTNYFPLRCSSNMSQYVLGRAFLQETYLFVDYEKSTFSLSQAQFNKHSNVVTVNHQASNTPSGAA